MTIRTDTSARRLHLETRHDLARRIDDTRLMFKPGENPEEIIRSLCENALLEDFRAVCVRPQHVKLAKSILKGSSVLVATVIGFPPYKASLADQMRQPTFGDIPWEAKTDEMAQAKVDGADEFDVVMNIPCFKALELNGGDLPETFEAVQLVENAFGTPIKLIIETDLLSDEEVAKATEMAISTGIRFVKTSTGMLDGGQGATVHHVALIRKVIVETSAEIKPGIKASGGIRTADHAYALLQAGADILGSSAGTDLLNDFEAKNHVVFNL